MIGSNTPMVSVCIPTFNGAEYLLQAVESVLQQSFQNFEILIVDNFSVDQTGSLVNALLKEGDSRIRFYKNECNIGLVANLNKCLEHAKGVYIKFLCVDDLLLPHCIEQMVNGLHSHPAVKLVSSGRLIIDQHGNALGIRKYMIGNAIVRGSQVITRCLFGGNYIGEPSAVMFRKCDLKRGFREDLPQLSDMDMWFQLLEQGDLLSLEGPLCSIRSHSAQMTHLNVKSGKMVEDNITLFDEYSRKPYINATQVLSLQHKLLMSFRIWISRNSMAEKARNDLIARHASKMAYALMPVAWFALVLKRRVMEAVSKFLRRKNESIVRHQTG